MIETKDLELVVERQIPGELMTNALSIQAFVAERVKDYSPEKYAGKVPEAKEDRATLNKAAKELNGKRLELERVFMAPFQEFKDVITQTVNTIKDASDKLGGVISEVEQQERDERKQAIQAEYEGTGFDLVPLNRLMDSRWLNKSTSDKQWRADLAEAIAKVNTDIESLKALGDEAETVQAFYLDTLDIGRALQHGKQLRERREALQRQAEEVKKREADPVIEEPQQPEKTPAEQTPPEAPQDEQEEVYSFTIEISGTREQLAALREFIDGSGITYRKL